LIQVYPAVPSSDVEIVLPTGGFARIAALRGKHYIEAYHMSLTGKELLFTLIVVATTVEGKQLTYEDMLEMDIRDVTALVNHVSKFVSSPVSTPK
jgi:hypothetical protein